MVFPGEIFFQKYSLKLDMFGLLDSFLPSLIIMLSGNFFPTGMKKNIVRTMLSANLLQSSRAFTLLSSLFKPSLPPHGDPGVLRPKS